MITAPSPRKLLSFQYAEVPSIRLRQLRFVPFSSEEHLISIGSIFSIGPKVSCVVAAPSGSLVPVVATVVWSVDRGLPPPPPANQMARPPRPITSPAEAATNHERRSGPDSSVRDASRMAAFPLLGQRCHIA